MGDFDPVSWETREAALGPPAPEITDVVERMHDEVHGTAPYDAVKTLHDALYETDSERTVSSLGEPFITAYLLEKRGVIAPDEGPGTEYRSIVERRPSRERLEALFWEETDALVDRRAGGRAPVARHLLVLRVRHPAHGAKLHRGVDGEIREYREAKSR